MNAEIELFNLFSNCPWKQVADGNRTAFNLFTKHYSFNNKSKRIGQNKLRFCAPGERIVLLSTCEKALFVWSRQKYRKDEQAGVNCSVFRNESEHLSSKLITEAVKIAYRKWGKVRLFTFVDSRSVQSKNPGYCFKMAGWNKCGSTKHRDYLIFELNPD